MNKPVKAILLGMQVYTEGMERSLVRITYPAKEEGMATLKVERNLWNYLPRINRTIRIPPAASRPGTPTKASSSCYS